MYDSEALNPFQSEIGYGMASFASASIELLRIGRELRVTVDGDGVLLKIDLVRDDMRLFTVNKDGTIQLTVSMGLEIPRPDLSEFGKTLQNCVLLAMRFSMETYVSRER